MKLIQIFNWSLILVAITYGIIDGISEIDNFYNCLIRFSIIPVMLFPIILRKFVKIPLVIVTLYLVFTFSAHFLGSIVDLYHNVNNYDKIMHLLSGVVTSFIALVIINKYGLKNVFLNCLIIIGFVSFIAIMWEVFEFVCDNLFIRDAQNVKTTGVTDTMKDMISALIGGGLVIIMYVYEKLSNVKLLITRFNESLKY